MKAVLQYLPTCKFQMLAHLYWEQAPSIEKRAILYHLECAYSMLERKLLHFVVVHKIKNTEL